MLLKPTVDVSRAGVVLSPQGTSPRCSDSSVQEKSCCGLPSLQEDLPLFHFSQAQPKRSCFWQNRKTSLLPGLHIYRIHNFLGTNAREANHSLSFWASWRLFTAKTSRLMGQGVDPTWRLFGLLATEAWAPMLLCTLMNTPPAMKTISRNTSTYNKKLISESNIWSLSWPPQRNLLLFIICGLTVRTFNFWKSNNSSTKCAESSPNSKNERRGFNIVYSNFTFLL